MLLKRNIIANYVSQFYIAFAAILSVPIYAQYLGMEEYGVVGFYTMLQAWFQALDVGLSTTLSRESALYNANSARGPMFMRVKQLLEYFFFGIAALAVVIFLTSSDWIAHKWLNLHEISPENIRSALILVGIIVALRWLSCLYRGIVTGFEQQVWLGKISIVIATLRFLAPIPIVVFIDSSLDIYFLIQAGVAFIEFMILFIKTNELLKNIQITATNKTFSFAELRPIINFASGVALTSVIWIVMTQVDKLVLSKTLMLKDFGQFSMAVLLANGINILGGPISMALLPRMTRIAETSSDSTKLLQLYRHFTQIVVATLVPIGLAMYACSFQVMYVWTGDRELAHAIGPIMGLYALGNTVLAVNSFGYFLQYAKGNLRLHLIGNVIIATIFVTLVIIVSNKYGGIGTGSAWLLVNILYLIIWIPRIHKLLAPGLNSSWFINDVGQIVIAACIPLVGLEIFDLANISRFESLLTVVLFTLTSMACTVVASPTMRLVLKQKLTQRLT